jgi:8-oxo-dGTP diphosphatase
MSIKLIEDKFDGVTIDNTTLPNLKEEFESDIKKILKSIKDKKLLWIKLSIEKSDFIPILTKHGFVFHHCEETELMLVKKLISKPVIPTAKNYTAGVGAIVKDKNEILVIKDRFSTGYKLPGGHIDNNELLKDALKREVFEETGIKIEFESVVNLGHFTKGQFGESNIYVVCIAKPLTKEINIYDSNEIVEAKWIDIDDFLNHTDTNNYNKNVVKSAIENKNSTLKDQSIELKVPCGYEVFF